MPRPETPIDPTTGPVQRFAYDLRQLRKAAGSPSYRDMASEVHYSGTTLSEAARGKRHPSLAVTLAYVRACGGDPEEWRKRWLAVEVQHQSHPSVTPHNPAPRIAGPPLAADRRPRAAVERPRRLTVMSLSAGAVGGLLVLAGAGIALLPGPLRELRQPRGGEPMRIQRFAKGS